MEVSVFISDLNSALILLASVRIEYNRIITVLKYCSQYFMLVDITARLCFSVNLSSILSALFCFISLYQKLI